VRVVPKAARRLLESILGASETKEKMSDDIELVFSGSALRVQAAETQLRGVLVHAQRGHLTPRDRLALAEATAHLVGVVRLEEGLSTSTETIRSSSGSLADDLQALLEEEAEEAEEEY
jgi:hypothetical protein